MLELSKALQARVKVSVSQLGAALTEFKNVCYANSLGPESMVLTDLIWGSRQAAPSATQAGALSDIEIFSIDTGRLYPETYDLIERVQQRYGRAMAAPVAWDGEYGLHKVSPLLDWTEKEIWEYIRRKRLPYNTLHDKGFPSIGCAPCTRAVQPGDDQRSGRWWWERSESRECGLHPRPQHLRPQVGFSK
jgi:3'-phosphoadenosine 5'-phosphosulfate sulfotransferase (PAPS reductase)/FAD synthetase